MKKLWTKTTRRLIIIVTALLITFIMVALSNSYIKKNTDLMQVVVAKENINPYTSIKDLVAYKDMVRGEVPVDAVTDMAEIEKNEWFSGDIGFHRDGVIRQSGLTTSEDSKYGHTLSLEDGESLIGVRIDQVQGAGDYIKPGVLVDAIVYVNSEFGSTVIGPEDDKDLAGLLIMNRQNSEGTEPGADGRSLIPAVAIIETKNSAVRKKLVQYQEEGKIYLAPSGVKLK